MRLAKVRNCFLFFTRTAIYAVLGVLMGRQDGRDVYLYTAFEVPMLPKEPGMIDRDFLAERAELINR